MPHASTSCLSARPTLTRRPLPQQEQRKKEEEEWNENLAAHAGFSGNAPGMENSPLLRPPQRHLYPIATDPHLSDGEEARTLFLAQPPGGSRGTLCVARALARVAAVEYGPSHGPLDSSAWILFRVTQSEARPPNYRGR